MRRETMLVLVRRRYAETRVDGTRKVREDIPSRCCAASFTLCTIDATVAPTPGLFKSPKEGTKGPFFARMRKIHTSQKARKDPDMNYNTLEEAMEQAGWTQQIDAL